MVEIMVVIAIIAILSAVAIPSMVAYRKTAHAKACLDNIHLIRGACYANQILTGKMETDLERLVGDSGKGYLKWVPVCPVGGSYAISYDSTTEALEIECTKNGVDDHVVTEE